jgi:hypothetical protein
MIMCCDLLNIEDLCIESPEVENTTKVCGESTPVPATNDFGLAFVGGPL